MRILIVDDSANGRMVLKTYLNAAGYKELAMAASAAEAFQCLGMGNDRATNPSKIDLIQLDVLMPGLDGIMACRRIKGAAELKDIPILMVTGHDEESYLWEAFEAGASDYLTKPVSKVELQARVSSALALKHEIDCRKSAYMELEKQLLHSQKMASIGQLVGGVAHDFNNVLTLIMGYSQLGLVHLDPDDSLHDKLEQLLKASEHAASLTGRLLAISRKQHAEPKVIDLNTLVADTTKMLRRLISEDVELITLLWQESVLIQVDPTQIEQVLINLAINARDAMPGGGKLTVEIAIVEFNQSHRGNEIEMPAGEYALLSITDTGIGMTDDVKSRIFEPFFTTKEEGKGTGLGLTTCYGIVKQNGGCLQVDSQLGRGSTFRVYLRLAEQAESACQKEERLESLPGGTETILLAEDEAPLRTMVATILNERGYTVLQATNGAEGLRLAQERGDQKIDLLLSDIVMPQMSGTKLAHELKSLRPEIKVILTSGYTEQDINLSELGPDAIFIPKPFLPGTLTTRVREVLDS